MQDIVHVSRLRGLKLNIRVPHLVSLLMVGMTAAVVGVAAFIWASSLKSWLISGEE